MLLLTFVGAFLGGVFLHPFAEAPHECGVTQGHLDAPVDHGHDEDACAFCHLTQELRQATLGPPVVFNSAHALAGQVALATEVQLERRPLLGYCNRGPPSAS